MSEFPEWVSKRQSELEKILQKLLAPRDYPFGKSVKTDLPTKPGLNAISRNNGEPGEYLHAGVAKGGGLQRRIWTDHCQGGTKGTVSDLIGVVMKERRIDRPAAGQWIAENCKVRWVIEENPGLLMWAEDYIRSLLQPNWDGVRSQYDKAESKLKGESFSMAKAQTAEDKLNEIQKMAKDFNESLLPDFERIGFNSGGNLFLGRFYAESDRIYFGLNPGPTHRPEDPFLTCLEDGDAFNGPFRNSSDFNTDNPFGREFQRFLTAHPDLDQWFNNKVTSTFLCPWRTENRNALYRLNKDTGDKLFQYSSQLVWKMIEHHDAKVIVLVALNGVHLFNELFKVKEGKPAFNHNDVDAIGRTPGYADYCVPGKGITVLQIPRFSSSRRKVLEPLTAWLGREFNPFGL